VSASHEHIEADDWKEPVSVGVEIAGFVFVWCGVSQKMGWKG